MLSKEMEAALNAQIEKEGFASAQYLAMASWAENRGFEGTAQFLYRQSDEERMHMLKLFHYVNDAGGAAISPGVAIPRKDFESFRELFEVILAQEQGVSERINALVSLATEQKDHTTHNFLQWYVAEQLEEESLFRSILDKLKIIGNDGGALYMLDKDLQGNGANKGSKTAP
ncbi:MAG: ferritin [Flavobacteriales bacterium]|nr:ferritin [Flavobacteriales bacterium]